MSVCKECHLPERNGKELPKCGVCRKCIKAWTWRNYSAAVLPKSVRETRGRRLGNSVQVLSGAADMREYEREVNAR